MAIILPPVFLLLIPQVQVTLNLPSMVVTLATCNFSLLDYFQYLFRDGIPSLSSSYNKT